MKHSPGERVMLAIDTSHPRGSVAVTLGDEVLCEILFDASDTHSATLMPAVDHCLRNAKVEAKEINLIVVVIGPGSFTGLRIGLATAKAFAAALDADVVPVTSLEVLAAAFPYSDRYILPLIDARRGEVYGGCYSTVSGFPEVVVEPFSSKPEDLGTVLSGLPGGVEFMICGTGAVRYREAIERALGDGHRFLGGRWVFPSASLAAALALKSDPLGKKELGLIEPLYIRPPDAKMPDRKLKRI